MTASSSLSTRESPRSTVCLSAEPVSGIEWTVTLINVFNRISIASNHLVVCPRTEAD